MKTDPVILVCGFGRCGSSLVMQMLDAGGIPTIGEYPAYEPDCLGLSRDMNWLAKQHGKALKLIDPQLPWCRPIAGHYRIIWLDRNHKQQALSQMKFAKRLIGIPLERNAKTVLAKSYRKDMPVALKILNDLGPVLRLRFEDILSDPVQSAQRIRDHLGLGIVVAMALQVRSRPPECAAGMDMELTLISEREVSLEKRVER